MLFREIAAIFVKILLKK